MKPIFITGTGTNIGKTLVAAIVTESLQADYWKPVQAGYEDGTDSKLVRSLISNKKSIIHPEAYVLEMPASPHLAAPAEGKRLTVSDIVQRKPGTSAPLIIEGAGGLMVPLNEQEFITDLIRELNSDVIIVSKNELGSINHSLLTAAVLKKEKIKVLGWIFTGEYKSYEDEIASWSGFPKIGSIKQLDVIDRAAIKNQAKILQPNLKKFL